MVLPIEYNNKRTDLRKYRYNWKAPYSHSGHPSHSSQPSHPTHPRHHSHLSHPSHRSHPSGFFLVVLSGSKAALPDVGSCTFMEYYCAARKCNTDFIKGLQRDPNGSCRYSIKVVSERMSQVLFFFSVSCTVVTADSIVPHTNTLGHLSNYDNDHNVDFKKQ